MILFIKVMQKKLRFLYQYLVKLAEGCGRFAAVDGEEENKDGREGKVVRVFLP